MCLSLGYRCSSLALNRRQGSLVDRVFILLFANFGRSGVGIRYLAHRILFAVLVFRPAAHLIRCRTIYAGALVVLGRHLLLPFVAILLSGLFQTVLSAVIFRRTSRRLR